MPNLPWETPKEPRFKVGDELYSHVDRGRVIEVNAETGHMKVLWDDGKNGETITYPMDADYFELQPESKMPWE